MIGDSMDARTGVKNQGFADELALTGLPEANLHEPVGPLLPFPQCLSRWSPESGQTASANWGPTSCREESGVTRIAVALDVRLTKDTIQA
jgi:hypothetical protein